LWFNENMRKRSSRDEFQNALRVVEEAIGQPLAKNPAAVALGRRGGLKGGPARAAKLTQEQRTAIAQNAAKERWKKTPKALK
jgi:hypothetical protein